VQEAHNLKQGITPSSIVRAVRHGIERELQARRTARAAVNPAKPETEIDRDELIEALEQDMLEAADQLEFERAAALRDRLAAIRSGQGDPRERERLPEPGTPRGKRGRTGKRR
jgi:excinuclease ABC subunit B